MLLAAAHVYGQTGRPKKITVADYAKWNTLQDEAISADGSWISYGLQYDYGADTLFVQNCNSGKRFLFPSGSDSSFSNDGKFATISDPDKGLILQDLVSDKTQVFKDVFKHEFFSKGKYLAMLIKGNNSVGLQILDYGKKSMYSFSDVQEFSISVDGKIAVSTLHEVKIISPETNFSEKTIAQDDAESFKNIYWNQDGSAIAFLQEYPKDSLVPVNHNILYYNLKEAKVVRLDATTCNELKSQRIMKRIGTPALTFAPDGKRLFFAVTTPHKPIDSPPLEIWDSATPLEYHQDRYHGNTQYEPKLAVWLLQSNKVLKIGTNQSPKAVLTPDAHNALCYDMLKYEPQYEYYAPADIYLKNTTTGSEKLILEKQATAVVGSSPKGHYIHYFRNGNWYIYDIAKGAHRNLTANLKLAFHDEHDNYSGPVYPYESPGWSSDEKYFIVYDKYDIWFLTADGKIAKRITDGQGKKMRFRICTNLYQKSATQSLDNFLVQELDLSKGLILEAVGENYESGYFRWKPKGTVEKLVYNQSGISRIKKAANTGKYIYLEQTVSLPPQLMLIANDTSKPIVQSNPQSKSFEWASAELIFYKNKDGESLKGILYKPAGFTPGKKYPMVVFIYEKLSSNFHNYYKPTEYQSMGFTPAHYFLDGYLVLFPDIKYRMGNPGISAVDCVESAVNAVKKMGIVKENHIGIIGHSYGGFEASFIISQTNTFAAAVSGSGIMNLISNYFTHASSIPRSNAWRYESQQFRMPLSPMADWDGYIRNAPLANAANIDTPLLSWAGKQDQTVFWTQSAELHLALRRLKKKNIFLVYPGELHNILTEALQKDLTAKTKNWFDYYLKDRASALTNGLP